MAGNKKIHEVDMTHGPLLGKMISFAFPLILTSLAQTLFTTVDTVVVGRYAGSQALAAVGSTGSYLGFFTNFFIGLSLGVNVVVAQCFASKDDEGVSAAVHTSVSTGTIFGLLVFLLAEAVSPWALRAMGTPEDVFELALLYVRIRFIGAPIVVLYNFISAIFRSVGDTRRPLLFQLISGVINAGLNIYLVLVWDLGVAGVAIATVFSQLVTLVCLTVCLVRAEGSYRLSFRKLCVNLPSLRRILKIGVPTGLQSVLVSFSNIMIQSSVNSFGSLTMAAYGVVTSIRSYVYLVVHSFSQTATSFVGQNYGVRDFKRIRRISQLSLLLIFVCGLGVGLAFTIFSVPVSSLFSSDPAVIELAASVMFLNAAPYVIFGIMDMYGSCMRGMNHSLSPMLFNFFGTIVLRVVWVLLVFPHFNTLLNLLLSYPISWSITAIMQYFAFRAAFQKERLAAEAALPDRA